MMEGKSVSDQEDRGAISKLKSICGPQYTYKMENMISELDIAKELNKVFNSSKNAFSSAHGN